MKIRPESTDSAPKGGSFISAISTLNTRRCQVVRMSLHSYSGIKRHDAPRSKHVAELLLSTSIIAMGKRHDSPMKNRETSSPKDAHFAKVGLGKRFPDILTSAGLAVERHYNLFPADGSDEQWLEYCGKNGRIALSHNQRIRYTPNELAAVIRHRVALLIVSGKVPLYDLAHNFVMSLPRIEAFLGAHEPPYIAKVYRPSDADLKRKPTMPGTNTLWYPKR